MKSRFAAFRNELFAQVAKPLDGDLPAQGILHHLAAAFPAALDQSGQLATDFVWQTDGEGGSHVLVSITAPACGQAILNLESFRAMRFLMSGEHRTKTKGASARAPIIFHRAPRLCRGR